jgi:hypothetical protein
MEERHARDDCGPGGVDRSGDQQQECCERKRDDADEECAEQHDVAIPLAFAR